ncbi:MAG: hypothetical protein Q8M76_01100, partial [Spirochaetaceae bacterium]|nr:hypothetical protein [Spirochaetaceae bacterium]
RPVIDELVLERKARVAIEVNGIIARRFVLQPGSYRLSELSLASGMNSIVIKIEEEGEDARGIEIGEPFDSAILNHGELDYAISLGMDRASLSMPLGSAFISAGIGRYAEVGIDAQLGFGSALGGLSTLLATNAGTIGGSTALSLNFEDPDDLRTAFGARLSWRLSLAGSAFAPKLGAGLEYRGAGFSIPLETKLEASGASGDIWELSGQIGQSIPGVGANFAVFGNAKIEDGSMSRWGVTAGLTLPLPGSIIASFSGGSDWTASEGLKPRASIGISITPPDRKVLQYYQDLFSRDTNLGVSIQLDQFGGEAINASASKLAGQHGVEAASADYRTTFDEFELELGADYEADQYGGSKEFGINSSVSTAFVLAGGAFAIANPSGNAFALLLPSPSLGAERIEVRANTGPV